MAGSGTVAGKKASRLFACPAAAAALLRASLPAVPAGIKSRLAFDAMRAPLALAACAEAVPRHAFALAHAHAYFEALLLYLCGAVLTAVRRVTIPVLAFTAELIEAVKLARSLPLAFFIGQPAEYLKGVGGLPELSGD